MSTTATPSAGKWLVVGRGYGRAESYLIQSEGPATYVVEKTFGRQGRIPKGENCAVVETEADAHRLCAEYRAEYDRWDSVVRAAEMEAARKIADRNAACRAVLASGGAE